MIKDIIILMWSYTGIFWDWYSPYWVDVGISVSLLTIMVLGVMQVLGKSENFETADNITDHMILIGVVGAVIGWLAPVLLTLAFYILMALTPLYMGIILAKIYRKFKPAVQIPKASVLNRIDKNIFKEEN